MKNLKLKVADIQQGWMGVPGRTLIDIMCNEKLSSDVRHTARIALRIRKFAYLRLRKV